MDIDKQKEKEVDIWQKEIGRATDSKYGVLITHLYVESLLERYIKAKLPNQRGLVGKGGLGFSDMLKLAASFGDIEDQLIDSIKKLSQIRNNCAHVFGHDISEKEVQEYGRTLGKDYKVLLKKYPGAEKGAIAPISYFVCGMLLRRVLEAEGYK